MRRTTAAARAARGSLTLAALLASGGLLASRAQDPVPAPPVLFRGEPLAAWLARLSDLDPDVQSVAAFAAGRFGPVAAAAVPRLLPMLTSEETTRDAAETRAHAAVAATALGLIGVATPDVVTALAANAGRDRSLSRLRHEITRSAITALGELGPRAAAAVPVLIEVLRRPPAENPSPHEELAPPQRDAARALGRMGAAAAAAIPALEEVIGGTSDPLIGEAARAALARILRPTPAADEAKK